MSAPNTPLPAAAGPSRWLRPAYYAASASLIVLIFYCLTWELRLAPVKPGGSWLFLKAVPLLLPLFGILHGKRYTYQWSSLLILAYLAEGLVRGSSDTGAMQWFAIGETVLATVFFVSAVVFARLSAPSRLRAKTPDAS